MSECGIPIYYHISDRVKEHKDDDDKRGSKGYPPRTYYGHQWEIAQKHPWLMKPLCIFGIPVTPPGYYLNCAMTLAQVELMAIDVSVVDYGDLSKKTSQTKKTPLERLKEMESSSVDSNKVTEAANRWKEKYGDGKKAHIDLSGYSLPSPTRYSMEELKRISETT